MTRRTEFGSPRVVTVVRRRGSWLGVLAPELPNSRVGWIDGRPDVRLFRTPWSIVADAVTAHGDRPPRGRVVRARSVAVGRPAAPTPARALRRHRQAHAPARTTAPTAAACSPSPATSRNIPQGWGGGDRIAIHATPLRRRSATPPAPAASARPTPTCAASSAGCRWARGCTCTTRASPPGRSELRHRGVGFRPLPSLIDELGGLWPTQLITAPVRHLERYSSRTSAPCGSNGTRRISASGAARRSASTTPPVCS